VDRAAEVDLDEAYAWPADVRCVRANMVASVDGAAVLEDVRGTLSGAADRRLFAVLRGLAEVVLVGAGTVRRENYGGVRLDPQRQRLRQADGLAPVPPVAVVSRSLDLNPAARLFTENTVHPLVVTCETAPADRRAALGEVAEVMLAGTDTVDIGLALDQLAARGYRRVLCEGGPQLLAELVAGGHLHELCLTIAPVLTGPAGPLLAGPALPHPVQLRLLAGLAEDGALFLRYGLRPTTTNGQRA
jgi:riboflavin biosynthesis pyrimidine reductase